MINGREIKELQKTIHKLSEEMSILSDKLSSCTKILQDSYNSHEEAMVRGYELGVVINVVDGDTFDVDILGNIERVRIIGIDAPERGQDGFFESGMHLTKLLGEKHHIVYLQRSGSNKDSWGRIRRIVWLEIPEDASVKSVGTLLVEAGHAVIVE